NPAYSARECENHREHAGRNANGLQNDSGVEVDVRIQLLLDEVAVGPRDLFQLHGQFELRIIDAQCAQYFVAGFFHDARARVEVLVNAVTEAHQFERVVLVLGSGNELLDIGYVADLIQHVQHGFVCTAVGRSPQCGNAGSDTGKRVGTGRTSQTNSGSGCILFVIGVQDEDLVHGLGQNRVHYVVFTGNR